MIAASIRLRVGLGGSDGVAGVSSCSGIRVLRCLMVFGGAFASSIALAAAVWYGDWSASGGNMRAFRAWNMIEHASDE